MQNSARIPGEHPAEVAASAPAPNLRTWTDTASAAAVPRLRRAATSWLSDAGIASPVIEAVRLAVSEAVTNVVLHAYDGRPEPGPVHVRTELSPASVTVIVCDLGSGMVPRVDSPGAGLGLPLIMSVATAVEVTHGAARGTRVSMSFAR